MKKHPPVKEKGVLEVAAESPLALALVALLWMGACGEDDSGSAWDIDEPDAQERFEALQTGIYELELQTQVDECEPSIMDVANFASDWPVEKVPVNVREIDSNESSSPTKSIELSTPSPRHGEILPLRNRSFTPEDLDAPEPLITELWAFGGCSSHPTHVRITGVSRLEVEFVVEYANAPHCTLGRWSPQTPCSERFTFELTPNQLCDPGCDAAGDYEMTEKEGFPYLRAIEEFFGCECD
ncbi:MAG: hypothetical protein ACLFVJ_02355 [Persicimonas sp.]